MFDISKDLNIGQYYISIIDFLCSRQAVEYLDNLLKLPTESVILVNEPDNWVSTSVTHLKVLVTIKINAKDVLKNHIEFRFTSHDNSFPERILLFPKANFRSKKNQDVRLRRFLEDYLSIKERG